MERARLKWNEQWRMINEVEEISHKPTFKI